MSACLLLAVRPIQCSDSMDPILMQKMQTAAITPSEPKLAQLHELLLAGFIQPEEYETRQQELLGQDSDQGSAAEIVYNTPVLKYTPALSEDDRTNTQGTTSHVDTNQQTATPASQQIPEGQVMRNKSSALQPQQQPLSNLYQPSHEELHSTLDALMKEENKKDSLVRSRRQRQQQEQKQAQKERKQRTNRRRNPTKAAIANAAATNNATVESNKKGPRTRRAEARNNSNWEELMHELDAPQAVLDYKGKKIGTKVCSTTLLRPMWTTTSEARANMLVAGSGDNDDDDVSINNNNKKNNRGDDSKGRGGRRGYSATRGRGTRGGERGTRGI